MEMKLKGEEFWFLENKSEEKDKRIYDDLQEAVKALKDLMASEVEPQDIYLVSVTVANKDWKITQVPWSEIAVRLAKVK
ncbi:MAG: hypothetical protein MOIL_00786 [Candidatus Methanolliviera sp. GoM_oil]|nr:MAG: hypothetical protein MOIL_00786 [Candidatus Methanolliviera sp. GoM_oil]